MTGNTLSRALTYILYWPDPVSGTFSSSRNSTSRGSSKQRLSGAPNLNEGIQLSLSLCGVRSYLSDYSLQRSDFSEDDEISVAATALCSMDSNRFRTWYKIYWSSFHRGTPKIYADLLVAASFDLVQVIHRLLLRGEKIDKVDADGDTALHWVAIHNRERAALVLIYSKAPINVKVDDGNTPLPLSRSTGSEEILK